MVGPEKLALLTAEAGLLPAALYLARLERDHVERAALDDGQPIYPASMIKTPLAAAVCGDVATKRLWWGQRFQVGEHNMTVNDAPSPMKVGYVATVAELVELMLQRSDNVATNVLIDVVGRERATAYCASIGLEQTEIHRKLSGSEPRIDDPDATGRNIHPARDAATLFELIAGDRLPGATILRRTLAEQYWQTKLPPGLAPGDRFLHKTGDTDEVSHDGGILTLESGERYVLVVYTGLESSAVNDARFSTFMRLLRPHLVGGTLR